jgi:general L-amino acid transport system substrate-binding protein
MPAPAPLGLNVNNNHIAKRAPSRHDNTGEGSRLKIKRGQNAQWTKGGLQYGIPVR